MGANGSNVDALSALGESNFANYKLPDVKAGTSRLDTGKFRHLLRGCALTQQLTALNTVAASLITPRGADKRCLQFSIPAWLNAGQCCHSLGQNCKEGKETWLFRLHYHIFLHNEFTYFCYQY